jgi:hypothetical protein
MVTQEYRPVQTLRADSSDDSSSDEPDVEEREVRANDPNLSADLNARLTAELRDVIGADSVVVPRQRAHFSEGEGRDVHGLVGYITMHRLQLVRATAIVLTFALIVALATNKWWLLPVAAGVHALGTMTVVLTTIRLLTISEHPSPQLAAALSEAGIRSTEEFFSGMADEFRPEPTRSTGDVLSPGANERTADATVDPARAGAEQSSAMTSTAQPSQPVGDGEAPDFINSSLIASLLIASFVIPPISGDAWMWLLPVVMVPLLGIWTYVQHLMAAHPERVRIEGTKALIGIALGTTIAVGAFCAVLAIGLTTR